MLAMPGGVLDKQQQQAIAIATMVMATFFMT